MEGPGAPRHAVRVLAVDDSAEMRLLVQASLEQRGYSVHSVECGLAAIAAASQEPFDLVILDVDMPGLSGLEVGRSLRENPLTRSAKIAMHTSLDEAKVRSGFDAYDIYLPKPCGPVQLGERIDRLFDGTQTRRVPAPAD